MNSTPKLSLCMIVRDEEANLPDCLKSMSKYCDEMIVVDTGSSDRTPEIARHFGASLYHFPWNDSFSAARNESLRHASGDWIIYLDADEKIDDANGKRLRELLFNQNVMAYDVTVRSFLGSDFHFGEYPRLFRNHPSIRFEGRIHEQIVPSIIRMNGKIEKSDLIIDHFGYLSDNQKLDSKYSRNERLLLKQIDENPDDAFALYCLGNLYDLMGKDRLAIKYYHRSLKLKPDQPKTLYLLGNLLLKHGKATRAEQCYQQAHLFASQVSEVLYNLAIAQLKQNQYEKAIQSFKQTLKLRPENKEIKRKVAACYMRLGNYEKMNQWLN